MPTASDNTGGATRPRLRGFTCPSCPGVKLLVYKTRRPCAALVVRYRRCPNCGHRETTEEKRGHTLPAPPNK